MQTTAVYSCVRILSEAVASLPLHLYRYAGRSKERVYDHPLYHILHDEPNPEMTSFIFRETMMTHLLLWGNAYAQIIRDGAGRVVGLYPLLPNKMSVDRDRNGQLVYTYTRDSDDNPNFTSYGRVTLGREDVLHIPGLGFDGLVGYSPIAMMKNAVGITLACEEYGASFFANGATPGGVLEHPGILKDPKKVRDSWNEVYRGSGNAHKVAVLEEGMKYQQVGLPPEDSQFLETRKFQLDEIARLYRIPPHMVGDLDKSSFSNILKSQLEELAISFGEMLMPVIRSIVTKIQEFVDKLNDMDEGTRQMILKVGLLVAALGPFLVILGTTISKIGTAMKGFVQLANGFSKLKVAVQGGTGLFGKLGAALGGISAPVVAVVAVIGTLVAAFLHLWNTNEGFREAILTTWNQIKETVSTFCQGIVDRLNALGFSFQDITQVISAVWNGFCSLLAPVFEGAFQAIAAILSTVLNVITGILDVFIGLFTGNWSQMWSGIQTIFSGIWEGIKGVLSAAVGIIQGIVDVFLGWFGTSWSEVWTNIKTFFEGVWNGIVSFFSGIWETITNVVQTGIMLIGSILSAAFDIITLPFQFIWENCKEIIISVWNAIRSVVSSAINAVSGVISSVMSVIQNVISTIWTAISTKISSVLNTIKSVVTTVFNAIKSVASTVWNGIKSAIFTVVDGISSKVSSVFNSVKSTVTSVFNGIKSTTTSVWNGIKTAIVTPIENAKNTIKGIVDKITGFFSSMKISLPHIKLPHFKISGSLSIAPPSVPHLSIDWYKEGGIMTRPTLFGMNGTNLMAGGEAGAEAILPLKNFYNQLENILSTRLDTSAMEQYLAVIAANSSKGIYLEDGTLVGHLLPAIDSRLGQMQKLNRRLSL